MQANSPAVNLGLYRILDRGVMARLAVLTVASAIVTGDQPMDHSQFHDAVIEYYDLEDIEP